MKLRLIVGFSMIFLPVISAVAQDSSVRLLASRPVPAISNDNSTAVAITTDQPQQLGSQDALRTYQQQMQMVFQKTCEELDTITRAVYTGNITREQAEYLSGERFELGMMRFQLLRTLYLSTAYDIENDSQSNSTELYVLGATVVVPAPSSSADVPRQIATYLDLTPAQIAAIQARITEDQKGVQLLVEQLAERERAIESATKSGHFDEKQVRALAAQQSAVLEQLIVANAREAATLYSMLTSDQRARVDKLQQDFMASAK